MPGHLSGLQPVAIRWHLIPRSRHGAGAWRSGLVELAVAYVAKPSSSGVIVFLNAPNRRALEATPELLALIDPASPFLPEYRRWLAEAAAQDRRNPF
jgi:hypothetical protein